MEETPTISFLNGLPTLYLKKIGHMFMTNALTLFLVNK